jgi:hypothetical protein
MSHPRRSATKWRPSWYLSLCRENPKDEPMMTRVPKVAIVSRGDREVRRTATPKNNRFHRVFEEISAIGIQAEPAVYDEEFADEVREQF